MNSDQRRKKMREIVAYELSRGLDDIERRIATAIDEDVVFPEIFGQEETKTRNDE